MTSKVLRITGWRRSERPIQMFQNWRLRTNRTESTAECFEIFIRELRGRGIPKTLLRGYQVPADLLALAWPHLQSDSVDNTQDHT